MTKDSSARDLNTEYQDNEHRKYAYNFDYRMHDFMLRTFKDHMPVGRALEIGCFEGEFTVKIHKYYKDLTVVEGSSDLIEIARGRAGDDINFENSLFEQFEPSEKFDAIFFSHTLEHIEKPIELLSRIRSWLTKEGRLFLVVPNAYAASRQIAVSMGLIDTPTSVTEGERLHGHCRTYSLDSLKDEVLKSGLTIEAFGGILFKPLANFQMDAALEKGIIDDDFLEGCYQLGLQYPTFCSSVYAICSR